MMRSRFMIPIICMTVYAAVFFAGMRSTVLRAAGQPEAEVSRETAASRKEQLLYPRDQKSCVIQEDEDYIYICGTLRLVKIDRETGESEILWENAELCDNDKMHIYFQGGGLLIDDKIYFIEQWAYGATALSVIRTDGTGYERVAEFDGHAMLLQDGILYAGGRYDMIGYKVREDGTLSEAVDLGESKGGGSSKEYRETYYHDNGYRPLYVPESIKNFGYALIEKNYHPVRVLPETGEEFEMSQFGNTLEAYNGRYLLFSSYSKGGCLVDTETMERKEFGEYFRPDQGDAVITMDENYIYTETEITEEGRAQYVYEKISVETGERSVICRRDQSRIWRYSIMDTVVKNGYLYYVKEADYKLYLMRRNVEDPSEEEILGEALFDSRISEVGALETYCEELTSESGGTRINMEIDLTWLQLDDRFPGAAEINEYLSEEQRRNIAYEKGFLEEDPAADTEEQEEAAVEEWPQYFSYTSGLSEISYFDNHYLSFCQSEEDYLGGAHGMPIQIGYTFDLQTGDRLTLVDVIANSEEELKNIVTKYFEKAILANPDQGYYWNDALDSVRELTDLESSFYLTEKGIRFYFGPYILACFAAGFQEVTIPYEEFELKLPLGSANEIQAGMAP